LSWADSLATRAVIDGLLAQRKVDGDMTIIAPGDPQVLQAIISQGKRVEGTLRAVGREDYLKRAYEKAEVQYVE